MTITDTRLGGARDCTVVKPAASSLTYRTAWTSYIGVLPIAEGTVILLSVDGLPSGANARPVWLWWRQPGASTAETDLLRQKFLRRFDTEQTFRILKQSFGWTSPEQRDPATAGPDS